MTLRRGLKLGAESAHAPIMKVDSPLGEMKTKDLNGSETLWRPILPPPGTPMRATDVFAVRTQTVLKKPDGSIWVNGRPKSKQNDLHPAGPGATQPNGKAWM